MWGRIVFFQVQTGQIAHKLKQPSMKIKFRLKGVVIENRPNTRETIIYIHGLLGAPFRIT
jgi:hypothetical protein